ncbi:hypothetical protein [Nocardia sp. NPDC059691]|uniref:hypothetical protein n=1 Tax=Nocardia sp. NPDC059691 TaxID=3346908 RepID=UPI0036AB65D8
MHSTTFGDHTVLWRIARGSQIAIESLIDYAAGAPAYRMRMDGSIIDIPNGDPGMIYFDEGADRPDLAQVREWFPKLFDLWNAVRTQYWQAITPR